MKELMSEGYIPTDWAHIIEKNLSDKEARSLELKHIHELGVPTRFNRQSGERQHQAKMSNQQVLEIFPLIEQGIKPRKIAEMYGVSPAAIYMVLSGKQWKAITSGVLIDRKSV